MLVGENKPGIGGVPLAGQDLRPKNSVYPKGNSNQNKYLIILKNVSLIACVKARDLISLLGLLSTNKYYVLMLIFKSLWSSVLASSTEFEM